MSHNMLHDLKKCPFCGGNAYLCEYPYYSFIQCSRCGLVGKYYDTIFLDVEIANELACEWWNTRCENF